MGENDQGLHTGRRRYHAIPRVLIFLRNGSDVLLLKGAPNKRIWANKYTGVGGHIESGEDVLTAARREVQEETGLSVGKLELSAIVNINAGDPALGIMMFVFVAWSERRETKASHEGELHWVPVDDLPKGELVEDLDWLLPRILRDWKNNLPRYLCYSYDENDRLVIHAADHGE